MQIRETIYNSLADAEPLVTIMKIEYFHKQDHIRKGFESGALHEASFMMNDGKIITYEKIEA